MGDSVESFGKAEVDDILGSIWELSKGLSKYLCHTFEEKKTAKREKYLYKNVDFESSHFIV